MFLSFVTEVIVSEERAKMMAMANMGEDAQDPREQLEATLVELTPTPELSLAEPEREALMDNYWARMRVVS